MYRNHKSRSFTTTLLLSAVVLLLLFAGAANQVSAAIVIDAGPTWTPPGLGASGSAGTGPAFAGGLTFSYSSIDLGATANLYYGVKADAYTNGFSMDGGVDPSSSEIFRYSSHGGSSIVYTGSTQVRFDNNTYSAPYNTRMTVTIAGTGSFVQDATTASFNSAANGDVEVFWHVQSDFTANYLIEVESPANTWTPGNDWYNALANTGIYGTGTSVDDGFYYEAIPEPNSLVLAVLGLFGAGCLTRKK